MRSEKYGTLKLYDDQIRKMHSEGANAAQIARQIGFTDSKVIIRANKIGLSFSKEFKAKVLKDRLEIKANEIIELYKNRLSVKKIADLLNENYWDIGKFLLQNGYVSKKNLQTNDWVKYDVDETFFEQINTSEKAYILGWWYSDGNVRKSHIALSIADYDILLDIKKALRYTGIIDIRLPKLKNRKITYRLTIGREKMVNDIIKLGCLPNKSLILKFPTKEQVPDHLLSHFIRGYFDGDGSIYFDCQKHYGCCLIGTKEFVEGFINLQVCNGYFNKHVKTNNKNTWLFKVGKQSEVRKFIHYIYKDATIFLKRKKDLADRFLEEKRTA